MVARAGAVTRDALLAVLDQVMDPEVPVLSVRELGPKSLSLAIERGGAFGQSQHLGLGGSELAFCQG